jgi:hypothetical protein
MTAFVRLVWEGKGRGGGVEILAQALRLLSIIIVWTRSTVTFNKRISICLRHPDSYFVYISIFVL